MRETKMCILIVNLVPYFGEFCDLESQKSWSHEAYATLHVTGIGLLYTCYFAAFFPRFAVLFLPSTDL